MAKCQCDDKTHALHKDKLCTAAVESGKPFCKVCGDAKTAKAFATTRDEGQPGGTQYSPPSPPDPPKSRD